jgi:hypothetical protein
VANRHALLIGVPDYDDDDFNEPRLANAVRSDVAAMRAALEQSGYEKITECGTADAERGGATPNRIKQSIEAACANVPPGGVLLIYFSGHGLTVDGRDYLVATDSYRPRGGRQAGQPLPSPAVDTMVPVVPELHVLAACRAALVVFFVDACRNEPAGSGGLTENEPAASGLAGNAPVRNGSAGAPRSVEPGGQQPYLVGGGKFVLVMGCGPGQVCQYTDNGSAFTEALAKVLDPRNPARTLAEVMAEVTRDMERRSRQTEGMAQVPAVRNPAMLTLAGDLPVCDGDKLTDAWRKAVDNTPLLNLCPDPDLVRAVVAECARRCGEASATLEAKTRPLVPLTDPEHLGRVIPPNAEGVGLVDPWTDQDYPGRVLRNVEFLLRHVGLIPETPAAALPESFPHSASPIGASGAFEPMTLRPGEAALFIAAPFLREAVLAVGIRDAAAINPANLDREYEPGLRTDLELTHEMHQHLVRRAIGLRQREQIGPGGAGAPRAGSEAGGPGPARSRPAGTDPDGAPASDRLAMWLVHQWLAGRTRLWDEAGAYEVYALARPLIQDCRGSAGESELPKLLHVLIESVGAQPADERLLARLNGNYADDGWRTVAAVLWLAGLMAADPRRLPPVVPDLVGTGMQLPLTEVRDAAGRRAEWTWGTDGCIDLSLVCEHPALHDAFEDIVARSDQAARSIRSDLRLPPASTVGLPRGFTARGLRPATRQDDELAYTVPLARFQMAEEKVRELLMGRQLYGEPELAIRELYQNALDACRWRHTRQQYLARSEQDPAEWTGLIQFRQGADADGRPYLDCVDNGVGMDIDTLKHVFANAGERFVYGQGFRAEQADWADKLDPPLRMVSNSQFGIGVFSYFMLADEITVVTRHQGRNGVPSAHAYEVRIASSGSLFQINPADGLAAGGTRVRLYLSGDAERVSVLATLRQQLGAAEYRTEVTGPDGNDTWAADKLHYPPASVEPLRYGRDLWWVPEGGALMADGIVTDESSFGLVVNLRDERRPQFTVDRKTLRAWDKHWVAKQVGDSLPELMRWPGFTLTWLWEVAKSDSALAQQIFEYAAPAGQRVKIDEKWPARGTGEEGKLVSLGVVGCLPVENEFLFEARGAARWFEGWRAGVWRSLGVPLPAGVAAGSPGSIAGFPVPDPVDAALIAEWQAQLSDTPTNIARLLLSVAQFKRPLRGSLRRLRKYAITGLDLSMLRSIPPIDAAVTEEGARLLVALVESRPAEGALEGNSVEPFLLASLDARLPLREVARRARVLLAPAGWPVPGVDAEEYADRILTDPERIVLSRDADGVGPWLLRDMPPAHLAAVSDELGQPMGQVLELCDGLAPLGVTVPGRDAYPAKLDSVESNALRYIDSPGQPLSLLGLVSLAAEAGMSAATVHSRLARLEGLGLLVRPELDGRADVVLTSREIGLIDAELREYRAGAVGMTFRVPFLRITQIIMRPGREDAPLTSPARNLVPFTAPMHQITTPELVEAAFLLATTLAGAAAAVRQVYPQARLPEFASPSSDLTVPWPLHDALVDNREEPAWQLGPATIVRGALLTGSPLGDFLGRLDPFRTLGAPVPPYDEAIRAALNQIELDEYDLEMLTTFRAFGDETYLQTVTALTLIQIAGRHGLTPNQAHARLVRLIPLGLTLDYPDAHLSDEIVHWQDLLLLTTCFDGQPPAVSGRIDRAHLERAAEEIFDAPPGEIPAKTAWLRGRLVLYAPLFQLDPYLLEEGTVA